MTSWIVGFLTVTFWGGVIAVFFRWLNANTDGGKFWGKFDAETADLKLAREANDTAAIERALRRLATKWRYVGWAQSQYAEFLEKQQKPGRAIKVLETYIRRARNIVDEVVREAGDERLFLVELLVRSKRVAEAERVAAAAMQRPHMRPELSVLYAEIAGQRGDDAVALQRFGEAVDKFPTHVGLTERYVRELVARDRIEEAEAELLAGMRRMDRAQSLAVLYARLAHDRGDWEQAVQRWASIRENYVFYTDAYTEGAAALRELGQEAAAEAVLASRPVDIGPLR